MKVKGLICGLIILLLTMGLFNFAKADTVLFPVIASNFPNVTTIVSVTNQGPTSTHLEYIYSYKPTIVGGSPNYTGGCINYSFVRHTWEPDIVSFDASGSLDGGNALYNDPDNYAGSFHLPVSGATRSYLLVTNNASSVPNNRVNVGSAGSLSGEAIIMDISSGAAWGYKAINDPSREDFTFTSANLLNSIEPGDAIRFAFFPPSIWTTRFFVTPIGTDMHAFDLDSTIQLYRASPVVSGIHGRGDNIYSFSRSQLVNCTAAVDLRDLMDATAWAAIYNTGGWGRIGISAGSAAYIYKLEYVVNNPTYGGTNNNAFILSAIY